jgi:V8-like Glu-specific endopeptidase
MSRSKVTYISNGDYEAVDEGSGDNAISQTSTRPTLAAVKSQETVIEEVSGYGSAGGSESSESGEESDDLSKHVSMSSAGGTSFSNEAEDSESAEAVDEESAFESVPNWSEDARKPSTESESTEATVGAYMADGGTQEFFPAIFAAIAPLVKTILPAIAKTVLPVVTSSIGRPGNPQAARIQQLLQQLARLGVKLPITGKETDQESSIDEFALESAIAQLEVVIGADDRARIMNTTAIPWRRVCHLSITSANGSRFLGTGFLVGPRTIITAGHCVYLHGQGGWARNIEVSPGRNDANRPFGKAMATNFRSVRGWVSDKNRNFDYGAIILPREHGIQSGQIGSFGFGNFSDSFLRSKRLNTAGYPGDKPAGTAWFHGRTAKSVGSRVITYDIDTAGGQSGSPVWVLKDGKRYVAGIHTNGAMSGNSATRITKPVFDNIKKWRTEGS